MANLSAVGLSPSTIRAIYLTVSQVFRQAVNDEIIGKTPCSAVSLPSDSHHDEMHFLTPAQVIDLADEIDDRYRALIYTAAYGGLRAGELA
ncbi:MAG: site-specific integrase, partial [Acidimicrobiales bacterium]